jgi:hypothetical protein
MDSTLADLVDDLDRILAAPETGATWRRHAVDRVERFRDAWVRYHVRSDHEGGFYHDLEESEPRVTPMVRRLRGESLQMIAWCDEALAVLRAPASTDAAVRDSITRLAVQAHRYRSHETTATHEAVGVDLGSG